MVGELASCNALEPIFEGVSDKITPSELIQESVVIFIQADISPQPTMSESSVVLVT